MVDILQRVGVKAPVTDVYTALTTIDGLAGWWTTQASGTADEVGGRIALRFAAGGFDLEVRDLEPGKHVRWEVVAGPDEWVGTHQDFELRQEDDYAIVLFRHEGWREPVEFMYHCGTKWAVFLMSLKSLVETGKGAPEPDDQKIDNWN
jgi:uncharacterized protein YndB with AHSA1/START domain